MKKIAMLLFAVGGFMVSCNSSKTMSPDKPVLSENDTIRISNKDEEFDVVIFDPGFNSWFNTNARPRNFYTQNFLETRNRIWVTEWNNRAMQPQRYGDIYDFPINYNSTTDYGFEVNYMIFNYLTYFQIKYNQRLGPFVPRV